MRLVKIFYQVFKNFIKFIYFINANSFVFGVYAVVYDAKFYRIYAKFSKVPCIARAALCI